MEKLHLSLFAWPYQSSGQGGRVGSSGSSKVGKAMLGNPMTGMLIVGRLGKLGRFGSVGKDGISMLGSAMLGSPIIGIEMDGKLGNDGKPGKLGNDGKLGKSIAGSTMLGNPITGRLIVGSGGSVHLLMSTPPLCCPPKHPSLPPTLRCFS